MQKLHAAEINLGKLFSEDYDFVIPRYQRPYAWGADESLQLLDDLSEALERDTDEPYFLGSVVLVKNQSDPHAEVIDGQQRLTTLTLLFAVMRDLVEDAELRVAIHKFIEEAEVVWDNKPAKPRLSLRSKDQEFFYENVQTEMATVQLIKLNDNQLVTSSQKALRDNARAFHNALGEWESDKLKELFKMMGSRTFMVTVETPEIESAYRIFSVMNSRGLPLAQSDIFKSQVIGAIPEGEESHFADLWENLEEDLGRDEFANLFLYIRAIFSQARGVKGLLTEFPEQVLNCFLPNNGKKFMKKVLEPYARAAIELTDANFAGSEWRGVNAWMRRLNQLENDDWRPVALWALKNHRDDPAYLETFLQKLERLAASLLLRRIYTTPRSQRYMVLLTQLVNGAGLDAEAFELTEEEKQGSIAMLDDKLYQFTSVRKYVLLRLDSILAQDPGASYDHKIITVEHVLPQNPRSDSQWTQDFTEEEREYWTHRMGNLLLLNRKKNSQAGNYDITKKKETYFHSTEGVAVFALTTQVLQEPVWNTEVLERRHCQLKNRLIEEWRLA